MTCYFFAKYLFSMATKMFTYDPDSDPLFRIADTRIHTRKNYLGIRKRIFNFRVDSRLMCNGISLP